MILGSGLSKNHWGDAMLFAAYLINRLPSSVINWKTPFELLYGRAPDLTSVHSFGCLCYYKIPGANRGKLDPRGSKEVYLGNSTTQKGFKVLDIESNKIHVTRDAIFFDTCFPLAKSQPTQNTQPVLSPENSSLLPTEALQLYSSSESPTEP